MDPLAGIGLYDSIVGLELEESGDSTLTNLIERSRFGVYERNKCLSTFKYIAWSPNLNLRL